jgi:PAS domain S-box-containing protein
MFGYGPGELIGKHVSVLNASSEKDPVEMVEEIATSLSKTGIWQGEVRNITKSGQEFCCHARVSQIDHSQYGNAFISVHSDITERKRAEEELLGKSKALEELNTALKVLIDHYKNDQRELEERIVSNIRVRIIPYIEKLKQTRLDIGQSAIIEIIERSFRDISSPFLKLISSEHFRFTPKEVEIVSLIKEGKTTKEIAQILGIGKRTVDSYRDNIRSKLGLANKKVNLRTYLLSIHNT